MKKTIRVLSLLLAICVALSCAACGAKSPDPTGQTEGTATAPTELSMRGDEFGNGATGKNAAVSSFSDITSQVGIDILEAGGNAVDAAVATIFAVGVCEPHHSGIGGSGLMTIYLADTDSFTTIEYMEAVPLATYDGYYTSEDKSKPVAAAVPGQVDGLLYALEKYGTMTPAQVLAPAIKLAKEGFVLDSVVSGAIADSYNIFMEDGYEYLRKLFTDEGIPYSAGDLFVNEDLAYTLQQIADHGRDGFYAGDVAQKLVEGLNAAGNCISLDDLAAYHCKERAPVSTQYYGYDVVCCSYPTAGGIWELESLNIMEALDIKSHEQGSLEYWKIFNEAVRIGALDSYTYFGDQDRYQLPTDTLTSQEYANERAKMFDMNGCIMNVPKSDLGDAIEIGEVGTTDTGTATTHIAAVDKSGNIVSSTNTVGYSFGCLYAAEGLGFCLNNHMLNSRGVAPGSHLKSSMSPTIVTKDGKPVMAVGSPGSRVIPPAIMSVINNTLLYDMTVQEAINAPRCFILDYSGNKPLTTLTAETERLDSALIRQLELFGYSFEEGIGKYNQKLGGIAAIYLDPNDGIIYAGGDHRRDYKALAY